MTTEIVFISVVTATCFFLFLRVTKLEFEVAKLNSLVSYLWEKRQNDH